MSSDAASRPRLFHFSESGGIDRFVPRPVAVPSPRPSGLEWLNGPVVWTITEERQALYLVPRDCPRIALWRTEHTSADDLDRWWGQRACSMLLHVEWRWVERIRTTTLHRYELPSDTFQPMDGDWTWVSRDEVVPLAHDVIDDPLGALAEAGVELRVMDTLVPLREVWSTSLHASGVRLRNAAGWPST